MDPAEKFAMDFAQKDSGPQIDPAHDFANKWKTKNEPAGNSLPPTADRSVSPISETEKVPFDDKITNQGQWVKKKVHLLDGEFRYWEAKSGSSIFVDTTNLDNVNLLTPAIAQKLFPN
jgi:hypothetical protein